MWIPKHLGLSYLIAWILIGSAYCVYVHRGNGDFSDTQPSPLTPPELREPQTLHFAVLSDAHFDDGLANPKYPQNREYLAAALEVLADTSIAGNPPDFIVFNGDLVEYEDARGDQQGMWDKCQRSALDIFKNGPGASLVSRTLFTIGNNDILVLSDTCGPCADDSSLNEFTRRFVPVIRNPTPTGPPSYYWRDPLPQLARKNVAIYGLFLPDSRLIDLPLCPGGRDFRTYMGLQLQDFERWADSLASDPATHLALVFAHHGPVTQRTDGLPPKYRQLAAGSCARRMAGTIGDETYYLDSIAPRLARALEKLDRDTNTSSRAHVIVIAGHYHVGRVVQHLGGIDVVIDGALVKNHAVAERDLHTFTEIQYRWDQAPPGGTAPYQGHVAVTFKRINLGPPPSATPISRTDLQFR